MAWLKLIPLLSQLLQNGSPTAATASVASKTASSLLKSRKRGIGRCFFKLILCVALFFVALTLIFSVVPVPFSAYMAEKKIENLLAGKSYPIKYDWVPLEHIAWPMRMAVVASEDQNFRDHMGIDLNAIELAIKQNQTRKKARGASTISQQTIKNLYLWHGNSWLRKGIELPLTFLMEAIWRKERILEVYLNIAEFGKGIFGVEAASWHYFHKSASHLNAREAALLAAVLPNPIVMKVNAPSGKVRARQRWILKQIRLLGGKQYLREMEQLGN